MVHPRQKELARTIADLVKNGVREDRSDESVGCDARGDSPGNNSTVATVNRWPSSSGKSANVPFIPSKLLFVRWMNETASASVQKSVGILTEPPKVRRFEAIALPHLGAAYKLARGLIHDGRDAEDLVQEAFLSAFRFIDAFQGEDGKAWLLTIVRNACYRWLQDNKRQELTNSFDEEVHSLDESGLTRGASDNNPESSLLRADDRRLICEALENLPPKFREILVLRELQDLSYREIADVLTVPVGTVMSRLARARGMMRKYLMGERETKPSQRAGAWTAETRRP